jgi:hypothetical protein
MPISRVFRSAARSMWLVPGGRHATGLVRNEFWALMAYQPSNAFQL